MDVRDDQDRARVRDFLSREETASLMETSDRRAALQLVVNFGVMAGAFALFGLWPHPLTFVISAVVLAGRYVGLGILLHDAAHNALFRTRALNRLLGRWLFSGPTLIDFDTYRNGHLSHHRHAGTMGDPDLPFVHAYPVQRASMRRKLVRDLSGRTGVRDGLYLLAMSARHARLPSFVAHAVMFGGLSLLDMPWAYAAWWAGFIFVVPVCLRLRVMGEHGNVPDLLDRDARRHARTTKAGWVARTLVSPNYVNYHCEHHFLPSVPGYNLPRAHALLNARGFYTGHPQAYSNSYLEVLRACIGDRTDRPDIGELRHGKASLANMA
ncbi:MAG: fatty acid desaturase family protein [Nannocystaceae bacterium]|nr:fatty acid desaturase family protein [Nannocystaceae bacterium]